MVTLIAPVLSVGTMRPSSDMNATGFSRACCARYSTPPTLWKASRIHSLTAALSLFGTPGLRPGPGLPLPITFAFFVVSLSAAIVSPGHLCRRI